MSFWIEDKYKRIETIYWVYLEEVSLDFDSSWTGSEVEICHDTFWGGREVIKGCRGWVGPRSLVWVPLTQRFVDDDEDIVMKYGEGDEGPSHTSVIAGWKDVAALAQGAEYQHGSARLEIKRDFRFGASTVRLFVRKVHEYEEGQSFNLSVVIENIHRDEWDELLEYQQGLRSRTGFDELVNEDPHTLRWNERVIETPESPWQDNRSDITNAVRHVALEWVPLVFKYQYAQNEAIQRGLSYDDFLWEYPNHHETRVVRRPSAQTDTPLRALRLDVQLAQISTIPLGTTGLAIFSIKFKITAITRSPSLPNNLSFCSFRLDPPYAALANATIPNHSSQITEIHTSSRLAERIITTSAPIHVNGPLQVMGPMMMGDVFSAPIYGGNVGGRNNTNHFTAPPTVEEVVSAVMQVMRSAPNSGSPQTDGRTKRRTARARHDDEAGVDVEPPRKRRARRSRA